MFYILLVFKNACM